MTRVALHLGLHKTASGTLQRQLFPACEELCLHTTLEPQMRRFMWLATRKDPIYFDAQAAAAVLRPVMDATRLNLVSNESFSGPPYAGLIESGLDHRSAVLENLSAVFPDAKCFLVIRRQDRFAISLYRQYLKAGGTKSLHRFYVGDRHGNPPLMSLDRFLFDPYVAAVERLFPAGVLVLPFERFAADQTKFLAQLSQFLGVELPDIELQRENATRMGKGGLVFSRLLNHLFRNLANPGGILPGIPFRQFGQLRSTSPAQLLHDWYPLPKPRGSLRYDVTDRLLRDAAQDNRRLSQRLNLGLEEFGYY